MTPKRYYYIDALRGVAALGIVIFHYHHFYLADAYDRGALPAVENFPYGRLIAPFYSSAMANAVEVFWLISGFVFAHVYLAVRTTAWNFGIARFARLYPLHFITLCYVAVLQIISLNVAGHWQIYGNNDAWHFGLQLFMSSNWTTLSRGLSFNGPIWSVSLELIIYVIFFLSLPLLRWRPFIIAVAMCGCSWVFVTAFPFQPPFLNKGVFLCAGYFFLGTALYMLRPEHSRWRVLGVCCAAAAVFWFGVTFGSKHCAVAGFAVAAVSLCARLDNVFPKLGPHLSVLGDISYSVYLIHVPLQMTVLLCADFFFFGTRDFADNGLTLPLYLGASILLAYVIHHRFERPVGLLLKRNLISRPS